MFLATVATAVPAADVFESAEGVFGKFQSVLLIGFGAFVLCLLVADFFKKKSLMSAIVSICVAIFVGWLVNQYQNASVEKVFDETVKTNLGAPATPPTTLHPAGPSEIPAMAAGDLSTVVNA